MKVVLRPVEEVVIDTLFKTELDSLIKSQAISNEPKLYWCNGIMFMAYGYADNKVASKSIENHIQYYSEIEYAECPEFTEQAKWNGYSVEVQNKANHPEYEAITQSIKEGIQ